MLEESALAAIAAIDLDFTDPVGAAYRCHSMSKREVDRSDYGLDVRFTSEGRRLIPPETLDVIRSLNPQDATKHSEFRI